MRAWVCELGGILLCHCVKPFAETLVAAFTLNACYAFAQCVYWRVSLSYAMDRYFEDFTKDLWGICAGSGFADAWGLGCIPTSAG